MLDKIGIVINPGASQEVPILTWLYEALGEGDFYVRVGMEKADIEEQVSSLVEKKGIDTIWACGGDGTVCMVADLALKYDLKLGIVPMGTTNLLVKEIGLDGDIKQVIEMLAGGSVKEKRVDMGTVNGEPWLIRINFGMLAAMVLEANYENKKRLGTIAYAFSALKNLRKGKIERYEVTVDGNRHEVAGVGMMITNAGNIGVAGFNLSPEIKMDDQMLDVVVLSQANLWSMAKGIIDKELPEEVYHLQGKSIKVKIDSKSKVLVDEMVFDEKEYEMEVNPKALRLLVLK